MKLKILTIISLSFLIGGLVLADNTHYVEYERGSSMHHEISDASQTGLDLGTTDFTFEAWVDWEDYTGEVNIINKSLSTGDQRSYYFLYNSTSNFFELRVYSDGTNSHYSVFQYSTTLTTGTWYHIAVAYDISEDKAKWWLNGSMVQDFTARDSGAGTISTIFNTTEEFHIAEGNNDAGQWDGGMDDVRIWNDIRTNTEISDNYDCQLVGDETGLVSYWQFNNDATDENANGNDLTAINTPTYQTSTLPFTVECSAGGGATSTASSTIQMDTDWYSDDLTIITGRTDHYESSTTAPDWTRYHYFHIPFLAWIIIFAGIFVIGSRIILEIIIRFRNGKLR